MPFHASSAPSIYGNFRRVMRMMSNNTLRPHTVPLVTQIMRNQLCTLSICYYTNDFHEEKKIEISLLEIYRNVVT